MPPAALTATLFLGRWFPVKRGDLLHDGKGERQGRLALLSQVRQQNKDADTAAHGVGGFSPLLPEVQIHLHNSF